MMRISVTCRKLTYVPIIVPLLVCLGAGLGGAPLAHAKSPNVILVMADDLGIGDIEPTSAGCQIGTPNLQRMAAEGVTFTDAHTPSSVCTPTRYGLLTGRYNWRSRLARGVLSGTSAHLIPEDRATLGHLMRGAGYHTAMFGKWHLGWDWPRDGKAIDFTKPVTNGPDINGFDEYFAHCGSLDMPPYVWVETGRVTAVPNRTEGVTRKEDRYGWYREGPMGADFSIPEVLPTLFARSVQYVKEHASEERPFFLYLALPAPHTPIAPIERFQGASELNPYADFVMQVDAHMGELLAAIKEAKIDEQTLVIFTSDNGCSPEANFPLLESHGHDPSGGYRGHKADIFEGGHRVPLLMRWPGQIVGGRQSDGLACLTDVYATLRELTEQPSERSGGEDGFSLMPVMMGQGESNRKTLVSHSIDGSFAIRQGPWKLCLCAGSGGWSAPKEGEARKQELPPVQLYHLGNDPAETENLVAEHPAVVRQLVEVLREQVQRGRSTPGPKLSNDRDVQFLPKAFVMPE